ncbi:MAG: penicillin acylase family protein [Candidatus Obscuribacter sp.]|nr:penicillin acylase family protein [Candidatus Obscuribacter sp.]
MLRLISFFLFTAIIAVVSLFFIAQSRLPSLDGVINMAELSKGASVKFDERQVPYIEAANELDLYRVQGYITASHRLFQMDMQRRTAPRRAIRSIWSAVANSR